MSTISLRERDNVLEVAGDLFSKFVTDTYYSEVGLERKLDGIDLSAIASNTTRGIDATRDNSPLSAGSVVEAGVDNPCRVTTNDAELADLRWSDYAMYWDQAGDGPSIIYYAGSRTNGIETIPLDPLSPAWTAPPPGAPPRLSAGSAAERVRIAVQPLLKAVVYAASSSRRSLQAWKSYRRVEGTVGGHRNRKKQNVRNRALGRLDRI